MSPGKGSPRDWQTLGGDPLELRARYALRISLAGLFDPEHPCIEDLKRKDFIGVHELAESSIESAFFLTETIESFRKAKLLVRFLCNSLNLPF